MPTYQRRNLVCAAVRAIGRAALPGEVELIVVVDGSTDGTVEALAKLELPLPLRVLRQTNKGAASARNHGAAEAKGSILLFLDDDMICAPDLLEQHVRSHEHGAEAVVGNITLHPSSPAGFISEANAAWAGDWSPDEELTPFDIYTGQLSVRRSVFEELGGFDERYTADGLFAHEDTDFGARLLHRHKVRHNPQAISQQIYIMSPRRLLERTERAAAADARFTQVHPQYAGALMQHRGTNRRRTRYLYRPLARVPFLGKASIAVVAPLTASALRTPLRSSRLLRGIFGLTQGIAYWSGARAHRRVSASGKLRILCYHAIQDQSSDPVLAPYGVSPDKFIAQIDALTRAGFTFVSPDAVAAFIADGTALPRQSVLVTFDDCYEHLLDVARTILHPRKIPALAFAVTSIVSNTNEWDQAYGASPQRLMTPDQLKAIAQFGVEIGSHSQTHRDMTLLSTDEKRAEAFGSADDLERAGLPRPRFFAYPFGMVDAGCREAVAEAGYLAGGLPHGRGH